MSPDFHTRFFPFSYVFSAFISFIVKKSWINLGPIYQIDWECVYALGSSFQFQIWNEESWKENKICDFLLSSQLILTYKARTKRKPYVYFMCICYGKALLRVCNVSFDISEAEIKYLYFRYHRSKRSHWYFLGVLIFIFLRISIILISQISHEHEVILIFS